MCFYSVGRSVNLVESREGARIGCRLSSFAFALTVHDTYQRVQKCLDETSEGVSDGSFVKAAMDDCLVVLRCEAGGGAVFAERVLKVLLLLRRCGGAVGLSFENSKAQLLLPKNWEGSVSEFPAGLAIRSVVHTDVSLQGIEVVGAPIGSQAFQKAFVRSSLEGALRCQEDVKQLHPQCAARLLTQCVSACPAYLAQVCHPVVSQESMALFDERLLDLFVSVLGGVCGGSEGCDDSSQLKVCEDGFAWCRKRAQLPCRFGGAGLRCWQRTTEFSWYCSVASLVAQKDPHFDVGRKFFDESACEAYDRALAAIKTPGDGKWSSGELLPVDERDVLLESDFYSELFQEHREACKHDLKLQKLFSDEASSLAAQVLESKAPSHKTPADEIRFLSRAKASSNPSLLQQLFTADLSYPATRLNKTEFIISARQYLSLPALRINDGEVSLLSCGCEVEKCANPSCGAGGGLLDRDGNHSLLCHKVGSLKASLLEVEIEKAFRKAGGRPERQPSTFRLLGEVFGEEELRCLFSGGLTLEQSKVRTEAAMELLDALDLVPSRRKDEQVRELRAKVLAFGEKGDRGEAKAAGGVVRFDLSLPGVVPVDAPTGLWLDHAIVHESSASYQTKVLEFLRTDKSGSPGESFAFEKQVKDKRNRFKGVIEVASRLTKDKVLGFQPVFLFPVFSSMGFFNQDVTRLVSWLEDMFRKVEKKKPAREDGVTPKQRAGRYKLYVKRALCFGLLRGTALAVYSQGRSEVKRPPY